MPAPSSFVGGRYRAPVVPDFRAAVEHFRETLADVARHFESGTEFKNITTEKLLQGPLSDAMTHAGQLAMLRRIAGSPVPPENFVFADISPANLSPDQPLPAMPERIFPVNRVVSMGRRNTFLQFTRRRLKTQSLSWTKKATLVDR